MSEQEQYQGKPAEGYKPLAEWGPVDVLSSEEIEAWKRSPVARLESRVIATVASLERQLAEAQATIARLAEAHVKRFDKAADRILKGEK